MATVNEKLLDSLTAHSVRLLQVAAGMRRPILRELKELQKQLAAELAKADFGSKPETKQKRLKALFDTVALIIRNGYRTVNRLHIAELIELSEFEASHTISTVQSNMPVELHLTALTAQQIKSIVGDALIEGAPTATWWERQAGSTQRRFEDIVRAGILRGIPNIEMIKQVSEALEIDQREAGKLVQSSVQAVSGEARLRTLQANSDVVKAIQHVSTLDNRTSVECVGRDGLTWDVVTLKPIGHSVAFKQTPVHFGCRSTMVAVTKSFRELGLDIDEVPPSDRASMDGQVAVSKGFDGWLTGKSEKFQNDLLGAGKAQLWRDGKITLPQLLDQSGRPLSLTELKKRYSKT